MSINKTDERKLHRAIAATHNFVSQTRIYPRNNVHADRVALALLSKNVRLARAVLILARSGFFDEAFGLSRTMAEVSYHLRFIANRDTERRATRFLHFYGKIYKEFAHAFKEHFPALRKHKNREHERFLRWARKFPSKSSWTQSRRLGKGGAKLLAMEPDTLELANGKGVTWAFDYEFVYFWTSQFVHGTVWSLDSHTLGLGRLKPFDIYASPEASETRHGLALFNAGLYLFKSLVSCLRILKYEFPPELEIAFRRLLTGMSDREGNRRAANE